MDRPDPALLKAITNSTLAGGSALAGVIALCGELRRAGVLDQDATTRVRDAILADISNTPQADFHARTDLGRAVRGYFDRTGRQDAEPPAG